MQNKFKNRFIYKEAKIEMIRLCWDKRLNDMKILAETKNNPRILKLCNLIKKVDPEVKNFVLRKFNEQVQKLSWIHFYNKRKVDRPDVCDEVEINLQLSKIQ